MSSVSYEAWMQAQQSVLGSVLIDDRCASFLVFGLAEEDFCESYRSLYRAIRELYTTGKPVDPVAVLNVVGDSYKDFIVQLMNITPTAANCKMYVDIVKQQSRVLKLRDTGLALSRISTEEEGAELLANAASETVRDDGDVWSLAQGFSDWMHRYQKKPDYLDWFIPQLRRMIRAEKSDYFIVGARPSAGKSAFALQAALYWAVVCNKRVGFFSHETSREKLMDRLVACASGVPMDAIKERTLDDKQMEAVCSISSRINSAPLFLFSAAGRTVQQMQDRALYKRLTTKEKDKAEDALSSYIADLVAAKRTGGALSDAHKTVVRAEKLGIDPADYYLAQTVKDAEFADEDGDGKVSRAEYRRVLSEAEYKDMLQRVLLGLKKKEE